MASEEKNQSNIINSELNLNYNKLKSIPDEISTLGIVKLYLANNLLNTLPDKDLFEIFVKEGVYKKYAKKYIEKNQIDSRMPRKNESTNF